MSLSVSFSELFKSMNMLAVCLWITGFVLFCVEFFQSAHGVAYILGGGLMSSAFAVRMVYGSADEAFLYVFITSILLFAVHCVSLITQKRDWLRVSRMEKTGERTRKYGMLIDKIGIANTPIDMTGNVTVNDVNLVVFCETPIKQGEKVRIVNISADKITVEKAVD